MRPIDRWIPINLPWRDCDAWREVHHLSDEYATWFDARTLAMFGLDTDPGWDINYFYGVIESCPDLETANWSDAKVYDAFVARHTDDDVRIVAARRRRKALCDRFESTDTECLEWLRRIEDAAREARSRQFCDHEMCRAGVALEIRSPSGELRRVIIGDVDAYGHDLATPQIAVDDVIVRCADLRPLLEAQP